MTDSKDNKLIAWSLFCSNKSQDVIDKLSYSNKVILPESMLYQCKDKKYPLLFNITSDDSSISYVCSVYEFTATPGICILPYHIMESLFIQEGSTVTVTLCENVLKGSSVVLRPHKTKFIELSNPKAILEKHIADNYQVLNKGETIVIYYLDELYFIDVLDCKPTNVIDIVDTDLNLDFDEPVDYNKVNNKPKENTIVEPTNVVAGETKTDNSIKTTSLQRKKRCSEYNKNKDNVFVPFSGKGNVLGSK
tara:strand:- start:710 stop:1456 length:747 start_codon:yes stop_codon:yes gene_type:complete